MGTIRYQQLVNSNITTEAQNGRSRAFLNLGDDEPPFVVELAGEHNVVRAARELEEVCGLLAHYRITKHWPVLKRMGF